MTYTAPFSSRSFDPCASGLSDGFAAGAGTSDGGALTPGFADGVLLAAGLSV